MTSNADTQVTTGKVRAETDSLARVRDFPGLSPEQRAFLARRLQHESDSAAADAANIWRQRVAEWKQNPTFAAEYERVLTAKTEELFERIRGELARVGQQVPQTAADLLTAESPIVDKNGAVVGQRPDWGARAKGLESIQRAAGLWNPQTAPTAAGDLVSMLKAYADLANKSLEIAAPEKPQDASIIIEGTAQPTE